MIWIQTGILLVLVAILVAFIIFLVRSPRSDNAEERKYLNEMVEMMKAARDEEERVRREKELAEYGLRNVKRPPEEIVSTMGMRDGPVKGGRDLIPYGLTEKEKEVLQDFYRL